MRRFVGAAALAAAVAVSGPAGAWGSQGHQLVGSIADHYLSANAKAHVASDLGYSLKVAAPWPDCAKNVGHKPDGFHYKSEPAYATWCAVFETPGEIDRMENYVERNWKNCDDHEPGVPCHHEYHYADVNIAHTQYQLGYAGTNDHDIVQAVNAAVAQLEGKPVPAPFSIKDNKEALFLLAHLVGDMHQPLHIGAVYLDPLTGARIDPDATPGDDAANKTKGGNSLISGPSSGLHSTWDGILPSHGTDASASMIARADQVSTSPGDYHQWAALWATDTLAESQDAFSGLTYGPKKTFILHNKPTMAWPVTKPAKYSSDVLRPEQAEQLAKAGKHLAELLNAIWP